MSKEKLHATAIAEQLAENLTLSKRVADDFIKALIATIEENLLANEVVKLKGLGTFKLQWNEPRKSVDVNTGDEIVIDGYYKIVFKAENELKELVNEPYAHLESVLLSEEGEEVTPDTSDNPSDPTPPLKLFNEQANEIKDIISEINALNQPIESVPQKKTDESKQQRSPLPSEEFRKRMSNSPQRAKSKRNNRKVLDYFFIASMVGGLLIYILVDFHAFSFFTDFFKSNRIEPSTEYYYPSATEVVPSDTIASDTSSIQTVDSINITAVETEVANEPIDKLQSLFEQPRVYKEFIATEEVIPGSRLTRIAERHYGVKEFWVYIYEANKEQFINPNQVSIGTVLKIPKLNPLLADKDNPRCIEYALHLQDVYLNQ